MAEMIHDGYCVTQSSVSRDFRDLGVIKAGGRYVAVNHHAGRAAGIDLSDLVTQADAAGPHLLVVKTPPGASNMVAWSLDAQEIVGLVGTVAGDDTLFVATANRDAQKRVLAFLERGEGL